MWKKDIGSWEERLKRPSCGGEPRRSMNSPVPSVARLRFLGDGFSDREPLVEFPTVREAAVEGEAEPLSTSSWVTFSGVDGGGALLLRETLNSTFGQTTMHYVPMQGDGRLVYVKFKNSTDAHWVVRKGRLTLNWESGAAVTAAVDAVIEDAMQYTAEVDVSWCTDAQFLAMYDRDTPLEPEPTEGDEEARSVLDGDPERGTTSGHTLPVLALLYTPSDNVWYQLLRLFIFLVVCFFRGLAVALGRGALSPRHRGQHCALRSLGANPIQHFTYWLSFRVPFAPPVADVDLLIWTWWRMGSVNPQRALMQLKKQMIALPHSTFRVDHAASGWRYSAKQSALGQSALKSWGTSPRISRYSFIVGTLYCLLLTWVFFA